MEKEELTEAVSSLWAITARIQRIAVEIISLEDAEENKEIRVSLIEDSTYNNIVITCDKSRDTFYTSIYHRGNKVFLSLNYSRYSADELSFIAEQSNEILLMFEILLEQKKAQKENRIK